MFNALKNKKIDKQYRLLIEKPIPKVLFWMEMDVGQKNKVYRVLWDMLKELKELKILYLR